MREVEADERKRGRRFLKRKRGFKAVWKVNTAKTK